MFYEVRIYDCKKQLKKTLTSKELSRRYWKKIKDNDLGLNPGINKIKNLTSEMRRKLDAQAPELQPH